MSHIISRKFFKSINLHVSRIKGQLDDTGREKNIESIFNLCIYCQLTYNCLSVLSSRVLLVVTFKHFFLNYSFIVERMYS